jgi:hypothetical protein
VEPSPNPEQAAAAGGEGVAFAPNMIGNSLLQGSRSISFFYQGGGSGVQYQNSGLTNIRNSHVADNNSPIPLDRVAFRYSYFRNAVQVTGISNLPPVFDPNVGGNVGLATTPTTTRRYDLNLYVFSAEKTFCDGLFSLELRIPFVRSLSSDLNLSVGTLTGTTNGNVGSQSGFPLDPQMTDNGLVVTNTPNDTLGNSATEFGDMNLIFKALLCRTPKFAFSGGVDFGFPTGPDMRVRVTDYDYFADPMSNPLDVNLLPTVQRLRTFEIKNQIFSASPFLAALVTPNNWFFAQGFLECDIPLNKNDYRFTQQFTSNLSPTSPTNPDGFSSIPFSQRGRIGEQTLLQADLGLGCWVWRNCEAWLLSGLAPTVELHYTTTLDNADIQVLPTDPNTFSIVGSKPVPEPHPTIGNLRNRVDILDMTVGATALFSDRATLAAGVAFPLRGSSNRTYDWEFQLQFNYYFGGVSRRTAPTSF